MMIDLSQPLSQAEFGRLVGRSSGRISQLVTDGTLEPGASGLEWLQAFIERLSGEAAGRHTDGELDLVQERAALARAQREGVEIKNATLRGDYASISLLAEVLATASQAVAERFDHLPGILKKTCPGLPARAVDEVMGVIAGARNEWVRSTAELVRVKYAEESEDDAPDAE